MAIVAVKGYLLAAKKNARVGILRKLNERGRRLFPRAAPACGTGGQPPPPLPVFTEYPTAKTLKRTSAHTKTRGEIFGPQ